MTARLLVAAAALLLAACGAWCVRLRAGAFGVKASVTVCGDNRRDVEQLRAQLEPADGGTSDGPAR